MSLFTGGFTFILTLIILIFAVSNREAVEVFYLPGEYLAHIPLYMVSLVPMALGFFFGVLSVWINYSDVRRDRRKQKHTVKKLEKEVEDLIKTTQNDMPETDLFPVMTRIGKR